MPDNEFPAARYRRFARECVAMAQTSTSEETRVFLIEMARLWQDIADKCAARPVIQQQQQQIQPPDDTKE
jgi:hypothetical protein